MPEIHNRHNHTHNRIRANEPWLALARKCAKSNVHHAIAHRHDTSHRSHSVPSQSRRILLTMMFTIVSAVISLAFLFFAVFPVAHHYDLFSWFLLNFQSDLRAESCESRWLSISLQFTLITRRFYCRFQSFLRWSSSGPPPLGRFRMTNVMASVSRLFALQ